MLLIFENHDTKTDIDQVTRTLSIMGTPTPDALARLGRSVLKKPIIFCFLERKKIKQIQINSDDARRFVQGLGQINAVPVRCLFNCLFYYSIRVMFLLACLTTRTHTYVAIICCSKRPTSCIGFD
jgi:hypothetical protein